MEPRHSSNRLSSEFAARQRANRRWFRAFLSVVILFWLFLTLAGAWLVAHPRALGTYLGEIASGFGTSAGGRR